MNKSDRNAMLILYGIFLCISLVCSFCLSVPVVYDETGTLASTAFLAGNDWSYCLKALNVSYYKPGLAILYLPIYLILKQSPIWMYRIMLLFGMMFISSIPVMAYWILRHYLNVNSAAKSAFVAGASAGIPSILLYSLYARVEVLLIWFPWPILMVLLRLTKANKRSDQIAYSILLGFLVEYAYFVHTRGIVFFLGCIVTWFILRFFFRFKLLNLPVFLFAFFAFFMMDRAISQFIKQHVYRLGVSGATLAGYNSESLGLLFTVKGLRALLRILIGWLFNLVVSTYGLFLFGAVGAGIYILQCRKRSDLNLPLLTICVYSLICMLGVYMMGILFFFPKAYEFMYSNALRADRMMYGRYTVCMTGFLALLALYFMFLHDKPVFKKKQYIGIFVCFSAVCSVFLLRYAQSYANVQMNTRYLISLTTFFEFQDGCTNIRYPDFVKYMTLFTICSSLVYLMVVYFHLRSKPSWKAIVVVILIASAANTTRVFINTRLQLDQRQYRYVDSTTDFIRNLKGIEDFQKEYPVIYINFLAGGLENYQPYLPDLKVGDLFALKNEHQEESLIITQSTRSSMEEIDQEFGPAPYGYFSEFNADTAQVILVRGEHAIRFFEERGYHLSPIVPL